MTGNTIWNDVMTLHLALWVKPADDMLAGQLTAARQSDVQPKEMEGSWWWKTGQGGIARI